MAKDTYMMPRNVGEAQRLNEQGRLLEEALDYAIHPDLAATLPENPTIADIGTGTGDFLVRLSKNYPPNSRFHGFDMSPAQFCPDSDLPSNVHLHVQDALKPYMPEFHNQFDLVHLRYLVLGLDKDDWEIVTRNLLDLLRPGGCVQWLEPDSTVSRQLRGGSAGSTIENLRFALHAFRGEGRNPRVQWGFSTLPGVFRAAGFEDVAQDVVAVDRVEGSRKIITQNGLEGVLSFVRKAQEKDKDLVFYGGCPIEEVEQRAREEIENGAYSRWDLFCTIGRIPKGSVL